MGLSKAEETELLDAAKTAVALTDDGMTPDEAVEKVARAQGFGPGKVRLVGQAYNTGRQLAQWDAGGGILDKLATFPLCDPEHVIDRLKTPVKTAAVSDDYSRGPTFLTKIARQTAIEKRASAVVEAPPPVTMRSRGKAIGLAKQAADEAAHNVNVARDRLHGSLASLVSYFKQAAECRRPFSEVEAVAGIYFDKTAVTALMDLAHAQTWSTPRHLKMSRMIPVDKRASADTSLFVKRGADLTAPPFSFIAGAIQTGKQYLAAVKAAETCQSELAKVTAEKTAALLPAPAEKTATGWLSEVGAIAAGDIAAHKATHLMHDPDPFGDVSSINDDLDDIRRTADAASKKKDDEKGEEKKAFLGAAAFGAGAGGALGRHFGQVGKPKDELVDDTWMKLDDPSHQDELRKIRHHAMLNSLLTDPDDPISGHEPGKVLSAFNELSSATPRLAQNVATLRPALRSRLEAHQEPFQTKELLDIEKGLAQTRTNKNEAWTGTGDSK